jgi:hypothetical protein
VIGCRVLKKLLQADLQASVAAVADGFGDEVVLLLEAEVNDAAFGRIENAKGEGAAVLADLIGGKPGHSVQLGFAVLSKAVGVDHKSLGAFNLAAIDLKEDHLKCVEQLAVFGESKMHVVAGEIETAALNAPVASDL